MQLGQVFDYAMPTNGANTAGLNPVFADRAQDLQQDFADAGGKSTLISGFRDNALQAKLRANYEAKLADKPLPFPNEGVGGMAARPGESYHNFGNAVDIVSPDQAGLNRMAAEPWRGITPGATFGDMDHYQIAGAPNQGPNSSAPAPMSAIASLAPSGSGPTQSASPTAPTVSNASGVLPPSSASPAAVNWGALLNSFAPPLQQAPAPPVAPQHPVPMPDPQAQARLAQSLTAGLPGNLVLANS